MSKDLKNTLDAFSKFNDKLEKKTKGRVKLRGFADIDEFIHTGSYILNAQLSGSLRGGIPNARSMAIAGDSGTSKTFLCLNAAKNAQDKGYVIFYIDTEGALDSTNFKAFGINMDMLKYSRMNRISELKFYINDIIEVAEENRDLKIMIIVDSVTHLLTDKEVNDVKKGNNAQDMGLRAKELRALFKSFTLELSNLKIPFLFTNHIYSGGDQYTPDAMSGGKGPIYAASVILMLKKAHLKDDSEDAKKKTGIIVRSETDKNRLAKPHKVEFHISFHKGMNPYVGLEPYISWDACGVDRGSVLTEREYKKLSPQEQEKCRPFTDAEGKNVYFQPNKNARYFINKWTGEKIPWREIFTDKVFTDKVIDELDKNVIIPMFRYSSIDEVISDEMDELLDDHE